ncbi:MAG: ribose-5-phosphate isomerase RpiA [Synechococcaceae cyanobacterium SM2_3_1]|nr:ribose-5-phosphate isomerase RpiA [Synechococcaceae cyanobacterium SM2_3_1]
MTAAQDELKQAAAQAAVQRIQSGMVVGLGTGSTAAFAVSALAKRMQSESILVVGVPTSARTAAQAESLGIPLATLEEQPQLDLAIDGADEIEEGSLHLIKGAGGALLREKLVEASAKELIIVADASKTVVQLGTRFPIPVEIVRFGWKSTFKRLEALGCHPVLRMDAAGNPFITDEQHYILDCNFGAIANPAELAAAIKGTVGVIEHGLFIGMATLALIATPSGLETLTAPAIS